MNQQTSTKQVQHASHESINASLAKLNDAYSSNRLDNYKALGLKDSYAEKTSCNVQWGPMMRA